VESFFNNPEPFRTGVTQVLSWPNSWGSLRGRSDVVVLMGAIASGEQ
jgi:hypothetical protein